MVASFSLTVGGSSLPGPKVSVTQTSKRCIAIHAVAENGSHDTNYLTDENIAIFFSG